MPRIPVLNEWVLGAAEPVEISEGSIGRRQWPFYISIKIGITSIWRHGLNVVQYSLTLTVIRHVLARGQDRCVGATVPCLPQPLPMSVLRHHKADDTLYGP